jgi:hypothetical protein
MPTLLHARHAICFKRTNKQINLRCILIKPLCLLPAHKLHAMLLNGKIIEFVGTKTNLFNQNSISGLESSRAYKPTGKWCEITPKNNRLRNTRLTGHAVRVEEVTNAHMSSVKKPEGRDLSASGSKTRLFIQIINTRHFNFETALAWLMWTWQSLFPHDRVILD